ncbi:GFA family protein [Peredibacter starrii]|uniref:GFA family protein n=1 Tax=Peredibacter starrii TaxID=28202 RepID=A0AAX4HMM7_9BACT|nr:GFA family protein [Peredibacter starrii]WPU64543.1 GFA family protein [Peredibacter starrii]
MIYQGGCHCGNIRYEVEANIDSGITCNCSICSKKGHILAFAPESHFKLLKGETSLSDYQFNKKTIHHLFCKNCGVSSFGRGTMPDGTKMVSINVRCLEEFDFKNLPVTEFDGKSH